MMTCENHILCLNHSGLSFICEMLSLSTMAMEGTYLSVEICDWISEGERNLQIPFYVLLFHDGYTFIQARSYFNVLSVTSLKTILNFTQLVQIFPITYYWKIFEFLKRRWLCSHVTIPLGLQSKFIGLICLLCKQLLENKRITQRIVNIL